MHKYSKYIVKYYHRIIYQASTGRECIYAAGDGRMGRVVEDYQSRNLSEIADQLLWLLTMKVAITGLFSVRFVTCQFPHTVLLQELLAS